MIVDLSVQEAQYLSDEIRDKFQGFLDTLVDDYGNFAEACKAFDSFTEVTLLAKVDPKSHISFVASIREELAAHFDITLEESHGFDASCPFY